MKVSGDPLRFCAAPPKGLRAALVYGANRALQDKVVETLQQKLFPKGLDDFSAIILNYGELKSQPDLLGTELSSFGFFASEKCILIKDAEDGLTKILQEAMNLPPAGHFLILLADALGTKSSLRAWAEKTDLVASLPCYEFDQAALIQFIDGRFKTHGRAIDRDAVALIADRLGNDLAPLPMLIQQIDDYISDPAKRISYDDIATLMVDQSEQDMEQLIQAIADKNVSSCDRILHTLVESGTSIIAITRSLQYYFYRLRLAQAHIKDGSTQEEALAQLRPPLFFKLKPIFTRHLHKWPLGKIDRLLAECLYIESQCKKTGTPETALFQQRFLRLMEA
jgi:DNA polymerase-3 subunit delta